MVEYFSFDLPKIAVMTDEYRPMLDENFPSWWIKLPSEALELLLQQVWLGFKMVDNVLTTITQYAFCAMVSSFGGTSEHFFSLLNF